jgi:hypothetical protein
MGFLQLETGRLPRRPIGEPEGSFKPKSVSAGRAGERIAGDFEFSFTGSKGDLEFHQLTYPTPTGYQSHQNFVCQKCLASSHLPESKYTDTSPNAGWTLTMISTQNFLGNLIYRSPLTKLPGWHIWFILHDLLHNLHLGPGKDHVASGVLVLAFSGWFSGSNLDPRPTCSYVFSSFKDVQLSKKYRLSRICNFQGMSTFRDCQFSKNFKFHTKSI